MAKIRRCTCQTSIPRFDLRGPQHLIGCPMYVPTPQRDKVVVGPVIHRNGTSREALLDQACDAGHAVKKALDKLGEACPNRRDYYPDPGRWERALAQHDDRVGKLKAVLVSLQAEAELIADGEDA